MRFLKFVIIIFLVGICISPLRAQDIEFKKYSYKNQNSFDTLNFSFDIPNNWIIGNENDGTGYFLNCKPSSDSEIAKYSDCFEGLIFKIKYFKNDLDSALKMMGLKKQSENTYLGFDKKIKIIVTFDIKTTACKGLYYSYTNEVNCKSRKRKSIVGEFQFVYFSKGNHTICIETNGRKLDSDIFNHLTKSFRFD